MSRRDFLPEYVPATPTRPPVLLFPGLRFVIKDLKTQAQYPEDRALIAKVREEVPRWEHTFGSFALTGFLVPLVPGLLGFRPFGRGATGIFKTALASTTTTLIAASCATDVQNMKWRYKDSDKSLTPEQRSTLNFHLGESARIRNAVLAKADLSPPKPPTMAPGLVRTWIHIGQVEIWHWRRWWAIVFWPESMEQSWQQIFADEKFRKTTISKWNKYLRINDPIVLPMVSGDTGSILFKRLQLQKMNPAKQLEWINSLPTLCNAKLDELKGIHNKLFDLNLEANEYLNENGERQLEWEQQFVQEFAVAIAKYRETTAAKFELDESFKAAFGVLPSYWDDSSLAVWKVTRLVKTQNEIKDNGIKEGLVKTSGETNVVKDAASAESVQTTTLETTETSTTVAKTVEKKTVGDEDKKTVEKGKDESGVEDS